MRRTVESPLLTRHARVDQRRLSHVRSSHESHEATLEGLLARGVCRVVHAILLMAALYLIGVLATLFYNRTMVIIEQGTLKKIRDSMFTHMESVFVGLITGAVVMLGSVLLLNLRIDDAVNAVPIHAFGGVCGSLLCCLFSAPQNLKLTSKLYQLGVQLLGSGVNFIWAFGMGLLMFLLIEKTTGLRVTDNAEKKGLNVVEFSDLYSWMQHLQEEHYENLTQDLNQKIQQQNEELKRQAHMLAVTQEKEREKIARDLHDGVGQSLVALKINLGLIQNSTKDEALKSRADTTINLAQNTIEEIRDVIYNLRPVQLSEGGLANSVRSLCKKLEELSGIHIGCQIADDLPRWNETEEVNIYRIVQECLTNIIKHSGATEAVICMARQNDVLRISISDNGSGFDRQEIQPGFGLTTMTCIHQGLD